MDIQTFQLCARYHIWATERLSESLTHLSDEDFQKNCGLFFQSIFGTLNHLLVAEQNIWFSRFKYSISPKLNLDQTLENDRQSLMERLKDGCYGWQDFINDLNQTILNSDIHYTNTRAQNMRLPFGATLLHVFNHATHHRGQITAAMTSLGYQSPELDMLFMLMQEQATQNH